MSDAQPSGGCRVIAIDGPAGSGKSTVARELARRLDLDYLDTGAMYRSVAFAALHRGVDPDDRATVTHLAQSVGIDVGDVVIVDGTDATIEIRGPEVTRAVSAVAANPGVRAELRDRQRAWVLRHRGGVVEGRDIGTVVFPDALVKVYLTAEDTERARRRHREATDLRYDASSPGLAVETVHADLARRDHLDSTRSASPLSVADDAVVIDTTDRPVHDIVEEILAHVGGWDAGSGLSTSERIAVPPAPAGAGGLHARPRLAVAHAAPDAVAPDAVAPPTPAASHPRRTGARGGAPVPDAHGAYRPGDKGQVGEAFDRLLYRGLRVLVLGFARVYWRLGVEGIEHLPVTGPYVVAPVHRSNLDSPLVALITPRRLRFMGKDSLWGHPATARLFSALGGFPVHRGSADRDALRRCIGVIEGGEPLVLFPEGTRQSGPLVHELYEGAAYVATRTGVPIVPVGIGGSERAMPKGAKGLRPVRIRIVVGPPLLPTDRAPASGQAASPPTASPPSEGAGGDGRRGSRRVVHELTERLHAELQALFDTAQIKAGG